MTRKRLEEMILRIQEGLEDALQRKAYVEAGPLQDELEMLVHKRQDLPTITELRDTVVSGELDVATAAKNRDFAAAAAAKTRLDKARKLLEETIEFEEESDVESVVDLGDTPHSVSIEGLECRADVEAEIKGMQDQVAEAIAKRDFRTASKLQAKIESREALRAFFPSLQELETDLTAKKSELADAVSTKDFARAERLHGEIERIEKQVKSERESVGDNVGSEPEISALMLDGEKKIFSSRYDLEEDIKMVKSTQSEAVAKREFKKAESCQRLIDVLESLRQRLPTASELGRSIRMKNAAMQKAINEKRFADAESLNQEIVVLQNALAHEKAKAPEEPPRGASVVVPIVAGGQAKVVVASKPPSSSALGVRPTQTVSVPTSNSKSISNVRTAHEAGKDNPVSKLRLKKPVIAHVGETVLGLCRMMTDQRSDAAIIIDDKGKIAGIITDTDVTRNVISRHLDPSTTTAQSAMTSKPICVKTTDSATSALGIMVKNHFRHLPVLDDQGGIVGLLDIAKCLNDAISKLEKTQQSSNVVTPDVLLGVVQAQSDDGMKALLGQLLRQGSGSSASTTLRAMLKDSPPNVVEPTTSVLEASALMADRRKAALIVEDGKLTGIFGFKDMMTRVVAKELPLDLTEIVKVMTAHPESVSPEMTVLEALQTMHENKFLTLPVCEADGTVVGIVDVMDVIKECGGVDGWQAVFGNALELDDVSEAVSLQKSVRSQKESGSLKSKDGRPVSNLRPMKPLIASSTDSVLEVAKMLASKRGTAALIVSEGGCLSGILTDKDVTRRVVAKHLEASTTLTSHVMTKNPMCVSTTDSATNAMSMMTENQFRHLPVVDENGGIVGLLDIAKCLNDAISKLEKAQSESKEVASDLLMQAVSAQGARGHQAMALQALLGPLLSQAFGSQPSPTLRSLLDGKPGTIVEPGTSVIDAAMLMAERRKAALVIEDNRLVGIFGFKDMMTRVVAEELSLETTEISSVMTPNPEAVSPDITVLEALQVMHDNKFLTLPVCEDNGHVIGVVDVMDLIHGCGGPEGWRSIFSSTLDLEDNSDTASVYSGRATSVTKSTISKKTNGQRDKDIRLVSKLRPKKPIVASISDTVLTVSQMLASKRGDAALLVGIDGSLKGIFTDTDVTRRVVAKHLEASSTAVSTVMTKNPTCVSMNDLAMDAMSTMVENHFRHLPVVDDGGGVIGLLDIARCLNDAISKLEKSRSSSKDTATEVLKQAVSAQGARGDQAAALQALLGPLMEQAFGSQASPTLRRILAGRPGTIVGPKTSVFEAGLMMAERRKAAVVVEDDRLVGIFGFKDMMTRVVARELPLDLTEIAEVMTPNPESVSPEMTVLAALQVMHDNKFLTLPVCEDDGTVLGLVDVMDLIYGCGGVDGWRSVFHSTLDLDDVSDTASLRSGQGSIRRSESKSTTRSARSTKFDVTVSMLRPKKPIISNIDDSILEVAKSLASKRASSGVIVDRKGGLAGIITDTDFTRRVVAQHIEPSSRNIESVMTPDPKFVPDFHSAVDAMMTMIQNNFRHLPVSDESGTIIGVLDIAKCLNDAISKLQHAAEKSNDAATHLIKQALENAGQGGAALKAILGPLVSQGFGNQSSRSLGSILVDAPSTVVEANSSVLEAAILMAESRKAALVQEDGKLVGIFGFKDMMCRVIAKELDPEFTHVGEVMTPSPEFVSPNMSILEALQCMHDNHFLTLPVCEDDGKIVGVVNVMDVINGCGGAEGWRAVFDSALDMSDDNSANPSASYSASNKSPRLLMPLKEQAITVSKDSPFVTPRGPNNIPTTLEFNEVNNFDEGSFNDTFLTDMHAVTFKILDMTGHTHRIKSDTKIVSLQKAFAKKIGSTNHNSLRFKFVDDEGDAILVTTDDDLVEAVKLSRASSGSSRGESAVVKLTASEITDATGLDPMLLVVGAVAGVAVAGLAAMVMMRPRRYY